jgi:hypothetical protein
LKEGKVSVESKKAMLGIIAFSQGDGREIAYI